MLLLHPLHFYIPWHYWYSIEIQVAPITQLGTYRFKYTMDPFAILYRLCSNLLDLVNYWQYVFPYTFSTFIPRGSSKFQLLCQFQMLEGVLNNIVFSQNVPEKKKNNQNHQILLWRLLVRVCCFRIKHHNTFPKVAFMVFRFMITVKIVGNLSICRFHRALYEEARFWTIVIKSKLWQVPK